MKTFILIIIIYLVIVLQHILGKQDISLSGSNLAIWEGRCVSMVSMELSNTNIINYNAIEIMQE